MSTGGSTGTLIGGSTLETITIAEIVAALNSRLKRAETSDSLINEIKAALTYLSGEGRWSDLRASETYSLVAGDYQLAKPADFRLEDKINIADTTTTYNPLKKTDFDTILKSRSYTVGQSRPVRYSIVGSYIELDAECDQAYTAVVYYWRWHPYQTDILFKGPFREAIYNAVIFKYLEGKQQADQAIYYRNVCRDEIDRLRETEEDRLPALAQYKDL